jgi:uncharacterized damage-inducible protein DinB
VDFHAYLVRLFEYDDWANREVIGALQSQPYSPHKAVRLISHVVAVEFVWLSRLRGKPDPEVWPEWGLQEVARHREKLPETIGDYLGSLPVDRLESTVDYRNTKGESFTNSVGDILMHVVAHSAYHRGQIAMVLRDAGITPPYTDYIHAVRSKLPQE